MRRKRGRHFDRRYCSSLAYANPDGLAVINRDAGPHCHTDHGRYAADHADTNGDAHLIRHTDSHANFVGERDPDRYVHCNTHTYSNSHDYTHTEQLTDRQHYADSNRDAHSGQIDFRNRAWRWQSHCGIHHHLVGGRRRLWFGSDAAYQR